MTDVIRGRVWAFGDDVNTDVITPGKYLTLRDPAELAPHIMEGPDPDFTKKAKPGDLIVAGKNFGCGSLRETASAAIKAFGIGAVVVGAEPGRGGVTCCQTSPFDGVGKACRGTMVMLFWC